MLDLARSHGNSYIFYEVANLYEWPTPNPAPKPTHHWGRWSIISMATDKSNVPYNIGNLQVKLYVQSMITKSQNAAFHESASGDMKNLKFQYVVHAKPSNGSRKLYNLYISMGNGEWLKRTVYCMSVHLEFLFWVGRPVGLKKSNISKVFSWLFASGSISEQA